MRVNLLHPYAYLFHDGVLLSLRHFSIVVYHYFQVSFKFNLIFYVAKIAQNARGMTELLQVSIVLLHLLLVEHLSTANKIAVLAGSDP